MDCGEKRLCGVRDNKGEDRVIAERLEWRGGKRKRLRWSRGRSARGGSSTKRVASNIEFVTRIPGSLYPLGWWAFKNNELMI